MENGSSKSFMCCRESTFYSRGGCIALLVLGWFSNDLMIRFGKSWVCARCVNLLRLLTHALLVVYGFSSSSSSSELESGERDWLLIQEFSAVFGRWWSGSDIDRRIHDFEPSAVPRSVPSIGGLYMTSTSFFCSLWIPPHSNTPLQTSL